MKFFSFILQAVLRTLFGKSQGEKLGAAEEKITQYERVNEIKDAMSKVQPPKGPDELDDVLRNGKLALLFLFFAVSCSHAPTAVCQELKPWSAKEQRLMADELKSLPAQSLLRLVVADYAKMREEARVCNSF